MTVFCNGLKSLFYRLPSCTELSWHTAAAQIPENSLQYVQPNLTKKERWGKKVLRDRKERVWIVTAKINMNAWSSASRQINQNEMVPYWLKGKKTPQQPNTAALFHFSPSLHVIRVSKIFLSEHKSWKTDFHRSDNPDNSALRVAFQDEVFFKKYKSVRKINEKGITVDWNSLGLLLTEVF